MITLADYLGTWEYRNGSTVKLYSARPQANGQYEVSWATENQSPRTIRNLPAHEVFRRIRDKQRGGFRQLVRYDSAGLNAVAIPQEALTLTLKELQKKESGKARAKVVTAKKEHRGFDFMAWLDGKD